MRHTYRRFALILLLAAAVAATAACGRRDPQDAKDGKADGAAAVSSRPMPRETVPFAGLAATLGPLPKPAKPYRLSAVLPFYGDEYWQILARGLQSRAAELGLTVEMPAASSVNDANGQASLAMLVLERGTDALLLAPISAQALAPVLAKAKAAGVAVITLGMSETINGVPMVGPDPFETGTKAAGFFLSRYPAGGSVAVLDSGEQGSARMLRGFADSLAGSKIKIDKVLSPGPSPDQTAADAAAYLAKNRDLAGLYCTSDSLALAVAKASGPTHPAIVGSGGESPVYDALRQGTIAATVDRFPYINGRAAVETAVRLLAGQNLPPFAATPQNLVTPGNADNPLPPDKGK